VASALLALAVGALTHPYAERASASYRHGAQIGVVVRYAVLGAIAATLLDRIARHARVRGSVRAALADRGAALLQAVALVVVVLAAVIPIFVGGYGSAERARDEHAGFVDGCARNAPPKYCECLWATLESDPRSDTTAERTRIKDDLLNTGKAPAPLQRAVNRCSAGRGP
jgi:hypothetical protein